MGFVRQDIKIQTGCSDKIDDITAVDRLFQGLFGSKEGTPTALFFRKNLTR